MNAPLEEQHTRLLEAGAGPGELSPLTAPQPRPPMQVLPPLRNPGPHGGGPSNPGGPPSGGEPEDEDTDSVSTAARAFSAGTDLRTPNPTINMLKLMPTSDLKPKKVEEMSSPVTFGAWMNECHAYFFL